MKKVGEANRGLGRNVCLTYRQTIYAQFMKKTIIAAALFTACCLHAQAQTWSYGLHAGINSSGYTGGKAYTIYGNSDRIGYEVGGDIRYTLHGGLLFASGLSILQTGGQFAVMSDYVGATGHGETAFPEVNTRLLSAEIPLKAGWDFRLGRNVVLSPHIGAYARYALASIKDNVRTANEEQTEKWNCLKNYNKGHRHIEAFKRFDAGLTAEVELRLFRHYLLTAGYRRGFVEQSAQYGLKSQIFTVALGYLF